MKVKNESERPVPIGRECIPSHGVADIDEFYLYRARNIRLRDKGVLRYPYDENEVNEPNGPNEPKIVVLKVTTDAPGPTDEVTISSSIGSEDWNYASEGAEGDEPDAPQSEEVEVGEEVDNSWEEID